MNMMKFARIALAVLAIGAAPGAATAQETFSDSHLAAARELALEAKALQPFDSVLFLISEQTRNIFTQADPTRAEEVAIVVEEIALSLAPRRSELNNAIYRIWAAKFTEEELKELAAFYKTPLGSKLLSSIKEITGRSVQAGRAWQDGIGVEMVSLVQEELAKRDKAAQQ